MYYYLITGDMAHDPPIAWKFLDDKDDTVLHLIQRYAPEYAVTELADAGYPDTLARLLARRGIETAEQARAFLNPNAEQLQDPFELSGMAAAAQIIEQAVMLGRRIVVFGDYDVDGICAVATLTEALKSNGADVASHIPERHGEGYGLTIAALEKLRPHCDLVITVDCGITALEEARWATEHGLTLIITDHHEPLAELPDCAAIVDPTAQNPKGSPLCGAGVAFKLVQAMYGWNVASSYLDLAALATVADLVPLLGENRVIAALGIAAIRQNERIGIKALIEAAGLGGKTISAGHLGFQIAPRLNSAGRIGDASRNIDLLLTTDMEEARVIAMELNAENERRQAIQRAITQEAEHCALNITDFRTDRLVSPEGCGWNTGVIGLAASSLMERYHLPTIVFSLNEKDGAMVATGSARSIPGVHIQRAMTECQDLFIKFGGHSQAAGCTLLAEHLPELRRRLNDAIIRQSDDDTFIPSERFDTEITPRELTMHFIESLKMLEPHGIGNPSPTFLIKDARAVSCRKVGADRRHLKLRLVRDGAGVDGIAFGQAEQYDDRLFDVPERMDALVHASINDFMGQRSVQFIGQKLLPAEPLDSFQKRCRDMRYSFERLIAERVVGGCEDASSGVAIFPLDETALRAQIADTIITRSQGLLMIARTCDAALDTAEWLRRLDLAKRVDCSPGAIRDPRAFHTLAALPTLLEMRGRFDRIAFLDIPPGEEDISAILDICPDALIWTNQSAADWREYAAPLIPTDEIIRALYVALVRSGRKPDSLPDCAAMFGVPPAMIYIAMNILTELGVIDWIEAPFDCIILPSEKRCGAKKSLTDSKAYRHVALLRGLFPAPSVVEEPQGVTAVS